MATDHNLRSVDIAQTHTLHTLYTHHVLDTAPVQVPPPVTLTHHMHTLLEASQSMCANVHVCMSLHFPDALLPLWLLQTVLCARGPISHVWWVQSTLFSLVSLSARSGVQGLAVYSWHHRESKRRCATSGREVKTVDSISTLSYWICTKLSLQKKRAFTFPGQKAAFTPSAAGASSWGVTEENSWPLMSRCCALAAVHLFKSAEWENGFHGQPCFVNLREPILICISRSVLAYGLGKEIFE